MARKRGNNEGSVYQRKDGSWVAAISLGYGEDGKPKRRTLYAKTRKEAAEKLDKLRSQLAGGLVASAATITVEQLMEEYITHNTPTWRVASLRSAEITSRLHITKHLGSARIQEIDARRITLWLRALGANETSRMARRHLRSAMQLALEWGWITRNPVDIVKPLPYESRKPKEMSAEDIGRIIEVAQADTTQGGTLTLLLIGLGLRISEALGLTWGDIDMEAGTVAISLQLADGGGYRLAPLKSKSARRTLHLPAFLAERLTWHKDNFAPEPTLGVILSAPQGAPYSTPVANKAVYTVLARAGIEGATCHDLRHAHASYLIDAGVPITVVSSVLGHSSPAVTMRVYAHKLANTHAQVAQVMDGLRNGKTGG